jgi:hypothetical protein
MVTVCSYLEVSPLQNTYSTVRIDRRCISNSHKKIKYAMTISIQIYNRLLSLRREWKQCRHCPRSVMINRIVRLCPRRPTIDIHIVDSESSVLEVAAGPSSRIDHAGPINGGTAFARKDYYGCDFNTFHCSRTR